jgi:hypothetical protein
MAYVDKDQQLIALSESERTDFGKKDFSSQSVPQKVFSAIWAVESEVMNGGFSQYFLNSSCETAGFVIEAMDQIGAERTASICRRAIETAFPEGCRPIPKRSAALLPTFPKQLNQTWIRWTRSSSPVRTISPSYCLLSSPNTRKNSVNWLERADTGPAGTPQPAD